MKSLENEGTIKRLKLSIVDYFIAFLILPIWVLQLVIKQLCKLIPERKVILNAAGISAVTEMTNMLMSNETPLEKERQILRILAKTPNYTDVIEAIKNYAIRKGFIFMYMRWVLRARKLKRQWD
jgi:hypothetical protein